MKNRIMTLQEKVITEIEELTRDQAIIETHMISIIETLKQSIRNLKSKGTMSVCEIHFLNHTLMTTTSQQIFGLYNWDISNALRPLEGNRGTYGEVIVTKVKEYMEKVQGILCL